MQARFSANTGFLWTDLSLPDRIGRAAAAGFDAVEFHDEVQQADPKPVAAALRKAGLPVTSLNVRMGPTAGCAAIPGAERQARADIDVAARLADVLDAGAIHVLAGLTQDPEAGRVFSANLRHALAATGRTVLIEPISARAMPGYFLRYIGQASALLEQIAHPRLRLLFDWYHIASEEPDAEAAFAAHVARIGHVQIASVPGRNEPGTGGGARPDYARLIPWMQSLGYAGAFGCEYRPAAGVEAGLGWLAAFR